jgi:hypothetical protein
MPGNPLVRFDEGRVGRIARCRPLSYSTVTFVFCFPSSLRLKTNITQSRKVAKRNPAQLRMVAPWQSRLHRAERHSPRGVHLIESRNAA